MIYKLYKTQSGADAAFVIFDNGVMTSFLFDENNQDYQAFLLWKSEGNEPTPADSE